MRYNMTPRGGKVIEVKADENTWKLIAEKLWELLDDIDTAGDLFKPPINRFFRYITDKSTQRHKYLKSDGQTLILTRECVKNIKQSNK
jgi:hypothetical protein